jgi:hypothetical protein
MPPFSVNKTQADAWTPFDAEAADGNKAIPAIARRILLRISTPPQQHGAGTAIADSTIWRPPYQIYREISEMSEPGTFGHLVGRLDMLRVECWRCDRAGSYSVAKLVAERCPDAKLTDWLSERTRDCPQKNQAGPNYCWS